MPPAGGGLVHPHLQCSASKYPGNRYVDELSASKRFHDDHGINYWQEYVEEEKRIGTRYIASMGTSHWLSSFLSSGVLGEVCCVFPDVFDVNGFGPEDCADLSAGLRGCLPITGNTVFAASTPSFVSARLARDTSPVPSE